MALTINGTDGIETNTDTGKLKVGIDDDLQIYHDGTNNYIKGATASQHVIIEANTSEIQLRPVSGEYALKAVANGATELYHNNAKKLETTATGATVTGTLAATAVTGDGSALTGITSNPPPFRNLIINGAMNVHQRIATGTMQTGDSGYTADRWRWWDGTGGVYTWGQVTESPPGFRHSHLVDCGITGSPGADEYAAILYKVEANDLTHLKYNTSDAQSLTLSFWVRSNLIGDWAVSLRKKEGTDRNITKTYTINVANTWEKKTITFPGDTSGGGIDMADDGINEGLRLSFCAQAGSNNKGGSGADSWHNYTQNKWFEGHDVDLGSSASNDWYITGVQLEVGTTATDFEHRSYADELARCQRYYTVISKTSGGQDGAGGNQIGWGYCESSSTFIGGLTLPVTMRTQPSLDYVSGSSYYTFTHGSTSANVTSLVVSGNNNFSFGFAATGQSGGTAGAAGRWKINNSSGFLAAKSEI